MISLSLPSSPELQRIFDNRTAAIYRFMVARVEEKNSRAGASARIGCRFVPFTQEQFASWVLMSLGGSPERIVQCAYCNRWLSAATFVVDHRIPMGWPWLGSASLHNLALSCASCNQRKGCISDVGFRQLMDWTSAHLDPRDIADIFRRLESGGKAIRLQRGLAPKKRAESLPVDVAHTMALFEVA